MDTFKLTTEPFTAQGSAIWQGTGYVASSGKYAGELADLLNRGLAAKKGETA